MTGTQKGDNETMGREEQIDRVMQATVGMYGDLQGIVGKTLQEIEGRGFQPLEEGADK